MVLKRTFLLYAIFLLVPVMVSATEYAVSIPGFLFSPAILTVAQGDTVTWTNDHTVNHTATSDDGLEWDSGVLTPGQSFSYTFTTAGAFPYHCAIHPSMTGTITVEPTGVCGPYVVGDFNGSNTPPNVSDVVAMWAKLAASNPQYDYLNCACPVGNTPWPVRGDVNNSCTMNIADVIHLWGKLNSLPNTLVPCDDCPPGSPSPRDKIKPLAAPDIRSKIRLGAG